MIITDIVGLSRTKVKVCIDEDISLVLYKSELRGFAVEKGGELAEEQYDRIMNEVLLKRAELRCMNLLKGRDYTAYQLAAKLRQGLYPEEIIEMAVAYVRSHGYVDDLRYAVSYIASASRSKSRKQIGCDLMRKGIAKETIIQAYEQCPAEDGEEILIRRLLEKKRFDRRSASYGECQKMAGFLYRKGFLPEQICKAVGLNCCE